ISIQLGVADAIADVVGSGRTLRQHNLVAFGESLCDSEAVLIEQAAADRDDRARNQLIARVKGVVFAQQYLMLDYDCPKGLLDRAAQITPGLESPTVAPLADEGWVAVRALVPRKQGNELMDRLADLGARAILATDIRSCRAFGFIGAASGGAGFRPLRSMLSARDTRGCAALSRGRKAWTGRNLSGPR